MKGVVVGLVLAACLVGAFAEEASKVEVLTAENFDEKTKEGLWLVKFYAPWCGHCKRLAPTWISLAEKAEGKFHVAEVDCTVQKALMTKFGIRGFPTIKFIANGGKPEDVRVPRTVEAYMEYMSQYLEKADKPAAEEKKPAEKPVEEKKPVEEQKPAAEEAKVGVLSLDKATFETELAKKPLAVKFFAPWCGHCKRLAPTWEQFAADSKDAAYTVAEVDCTVQRELCQKYGVNGYPTILYVATGAKPSEFNGPRTKEALQKWAASFAEKAHSEL